MTDSKKKVRRKSKPDNDTKFIPEIELDVSKLPSRGISYPVGATLKYRTYTFGEIRKISPSRVSTQASVELALSGITTNFPKNELTFMDVLYVGILRKISTLSGIKFEVPFICSDCGQKSKNVYTEKDLTFKDISEDVVKLPIVTKLCEKELHFSVLTIKDYFDMLSGKYDEVFVDGKFDRIAMQAITIKNIPFKEAYELIYNINNSDDIDVLTDIDTLLQHSIDPLKGICDNKVKGSNEICGAETNIVIEGREVLLTPFRKDKSTSRSRIHFGVSSKLESISD